MEISVVIRGEAKVVFCFVFARTQRGGFLAQDENANFATPHGLGEIENHPPLPGSDGGKRAHLVGLINQEDWAVYGL